MVEMFVSGDVSEIAHVVADDYHDHQGLGGSPVSGPAGFTSVVAAARSGYRELRVVIVQAEQTDDRVLATIHWRGIRTGGVSVERDTEDEIRVVDGRAVEHWGRTKPWEADDQSPRSRTRHDHGDRHPGHPPRSEVRVQPRLARCRSDTRAAPQNRSPWSTAVIVAVYEPRLVFGPEVRRCEQSRCPERWDRAERRTRNVSVGEVEPPCWDRVPRRRASLHRPWNAPRGTREVRRRTLDRASLRKRLNACQPVPVRRPTVHRADVRFVGGRHRAVPRDQPIAASANPQAATTVRADDQWQPTPRPG